MKKCRKRKRVQDAHDRHWKFIENAVEDIKNLETAQKTIDTLLAEKKKREKELELLHSSKSKLQEERHNMQISMERMRSEMIDFQNLENLRRNFENTKSLLVEQ